MAAAYTADDLLDQVRRGGSLPSAASTGTADADLLAHADAEIRDTLVPELLGVREEYYQRVFDSTVVAGTAAYRINKRASLSRVNTVQWLNSDGSIINLNRYEPKQAADLSLLVGTTGQPTSYYLEGSRIVLTPTPSASATLRIRAMVRPSRLTLTTDATNVFAIVSVSAPTASTTRIDVVSASLALGLSPPIDVVSATPSFEHFACDAAADSNSAGTTGQRNIVFANTNFSTIPEAGDYLCTADYTPVVQLPVELQPTLVELTIARVLRALGKRAEAADHAEEARRMLAAGIQALTPRVDSADRKILGGPHWRRWRGLGLRGGGW